MTFKQFAFNNVKRNTRAYLSYFLSCMFAVTVFFMYAVVIFHPDIANFEFQAAVQRGIISSEVMIYGFSFLFVLYSTGSFINSRKKEYGLLTTLGISKSQLNRMIIMENTIIGIASIIAGIIVGALLTKLFLMVFSLVLELDHTLPFYLSLKAIGLTALLFFIMFEINSLAVVWTLRTKSVMDIFRGAKTAKKAPRFSYILSFLSLAAIGYAYYLAYSADWTNIFYRMLLILVFIIPGTYFFFTQFSIAFTNALRKRKYLYFRNLNMLTVSDLTFKLKDNARLLFLVTILSAVAFTSSGVLYGLFQSVQTEAERFVPQDVTLVAEGNKNQEEFLIRVADFEAGFHRENIPYESMTVNGTLVKSRSEFHDWNNLSLQIYAYTDYKKMVEMNGETAAPEIVGNKAYIMMNDLIYMKVWDPLSGFSIASKNEVSNLSVEKIDMQLNNNIYAYFTMIVPDELFNRFYQVAEGENITYTYAMNVPNWVSYANEIAEITSYDFNGAVFPDSQAEFYISMKEGMSYLFFFGIFISVLFFLAAGSILYFRMYQDIDKDLHHFHSLYRIGLTDKEMKQIATKQLSMLFFIPFFVAVVHAIFAFKILQNLLSASIVLPSIIVISLYFTVHFANFIFIRNIYTAKLKKVM